METVTAVKKPPDLKDYSNGIYIAKGIGITLVVIGHYMPEQRPDYWIMVHDVIYTFHMAIFIMLSGLLYAAREQIMDFAQYKQMLNKKLSRLLLPYVSIALLIFLLKVSGGLFFRLQAPVTLTSTSNIVFNPNVSYAPLLWFLYVLFLIYIIYPIVDLPIKSNYLFLCLLPILSLFPMPQIFMLPQLFYYLPIFALGVIAFRINFPGNGIKRALLGSLIIFLSLIIVFLFWWRDAFPKLSDIPVAFRLLLGISGSASCILMALMISHRKGFMFNLLKYLGIYSMGIYLLHACLMGPIRIFFYQVLKLTNSWFLFTAIFTITIGIMGSIFIENNFLRRSRVAARCFLGIRL
jgi:fucose 4-O-acetylase-like acetyltransferase